MFYPEALPGSNDSANEERSTKRRRGRKDEFIGIRMTARRNFKSKHARLYDAE
ncbi:hypothetical protein Krac_0158 [Ktedonobacter racemifer DSM 44963]|uniref:Uncharacterized protein n=1 Tax=Ktedonobacter racemifer DSM 44963 TaxID=485913 RepID=D6U713_KTERA|nr:hypothetical protein Krac_0158 [Ktedonobacter racemifer DSM 44963]